MMMMMMMMMMYRKTCAYTIMYLVSAEISKVKKVEDSIY